MMAVSVTSVGIGCESQSPASAAGPIGRSCETGPEPQKRGMGESVGRISIADTEKLYQQLLTSKGSLLIELIPTIIQLRH